MNSAAAEQYYQEIGCDPNENKKIRWRVRVTVIPGYPFTISEHTTNVEIRGPVLTLLIKPLYYSNLVLVLVVFQHLINKGRG